MKGSELGRSYSGNNLAKTVAAQQDRVRQQQEAVGVVGQSYGQFAAELAALGQAYETQKAQAEAARQQALAEQQAAWAAQQAARPATLTVREKTAPQPAEKSKEAGGAQQSAVERPLSRPEPRLAPPPVERGGDIEM